VGDRPAAFLGLHPRAPVAGERWADVSLLASTSGTVDRILETLLAASLPVLRAQGVTGLVCLTGEIWLRNALACAGFAGADRVITYLRSNRPLLAEVERPAHLRAAGPGDASTILELNALAFAPLWCYDEATTLSWLLTAEHPVLAEVERRPVAFALTARSTGDGYTQLIRIATHPAWQGQGIGRQLVVDAINYGHSSGAVGVALNTQFSNATSRHLYEALGFRSVGPVVDVMVYHLA
jgi:[ribosomal protein S18]-alanine N-acetyltransferase